MLHILPGAKAVLKIFFPYFLANFFIFLSLLIVMILHFLVDAVGGLLTIKYMKEHDQQSNEENNFV
jgi:hypothetical protein